MIISSDTTWAAGQTFTLNENIEIAPGATLTVEAGATVIGNGFRIVAYGSLDAGGQSAARVNFDNVTFLFGSDHSTPGTIRIDNASITGGEFLPATGNASYGHFAVSDSVLHGVGGFYIWYPTDDSSFIRNVFIGTAKISAGVTGVKFTVRDNTFVSHVDGGLGGDSAAIQSWNSSTYVSGTGADVSNVIVSGNSFLATSQLALSLQSGYSGAGMMAEGNYFGTTDLAEIAARILDRSDSLSRARYIDYDPILTAASAAAPHWGSGSSDDYSGTAGSNIAFGNGGRDVLRGRGGSDYLIGGSGADTLDGGSGGDLMVGGAGDDTYVVDDPGDLVVETETSVTLISRDTVFSKLGAYALPARVEIGRIVSIDSANLTGNGLANTLIAGVGNNAIRGGTGADTVDYRFASSAVTVDLSVGVAQETGGSGRDRLVSIENLAGSQYDDSLAGNAAANLLDGGAGADTLLGGAGSDTLIGGDGADVFQVDGVTGSDTVADFTTGVDTLRISQSTIAVGNGDLGIDGAVIIDNGGHDVSAELVIVTTNITGVISAVSAAELIGSASSSYAPGDTALFFVDSGKNGAVYLFESSGADAMVSADELTLLVRLTGATTASAGDFVFGT